MSRRDNAENRCAECALHHPLCLCSLVPRIETASKLCLVLHRDEARKPTNTGRLAARCLVGSEVLVHGAQGQRVADPRGDAISSVLLYPCEQARELDASYLAKGPIRLVVPDGTWRQAAKMGRRIPWMKDLPRVSLPAGEVTGYRLRSEPKEGGLATMEAIARAFGVLAGKQVQADLERVFRILVDRTLYSRGLLSREEVFGGVPAGVMRHRVH